MIKIPIGDGETITCRQNLNSKFVLTDTALDGAELIPIDCGGRLIAPTTTVNELGKQLLKAAGEGNVEETKALLNRGALFTADWLGTSPLHLAARNNHLAVCEILLKAGISKDARTKVDKTSLHMAAFEGHLSIVEVLLEFGADPDCRDLLGMTPLHWAAQNGHSEVVKTLVKHFAQTDAVNKFDLTPADIATQMNRHDIVELMTILINEPSSSSVNGHQHSSDIVETSDDSQQLSENFHNSTSNSPIPLETILLEEQDNSIDPETLNIQSASDDGDFTFEESNHNQNFSESLKLLREHGITMLPHEEDNDILTTVLESGHSVVLTDIGKQVLNSMKESEEAAEQKCKKVITVTPEEFLAMATNCTTNTSSNAFKHVNGKIVQRNMKRIVMKKNKVVPVSTTINNVFRYKKSASSSDMEIIMNQLIEAQKTIEEYKVKLFKKELEAEKYKQQLKLLLQESQ